MELYKLLVLVQLLFLSVSIRASATEYFVSINGEDHNPGTLEKPWRHVQKAVTSLTPGDTCTIRGGVYSEEVTITELQGTKENPITFRSYPGETVTFDCTIPIINSWEKYKDHIFVTTLKEDIWQLFVDGEMQINARWPNAFWYDFSVFDYTRWGFADAKSTFDPPTGTGVIVDNGTQGLAKSGLNVTGAIAILNIGSWLTWAAFVDQHNSGESNFSFNLHQKLNSPYIDFHGQNSRYFLEDKLEFLDAPTEWFYDKNTKKLYLWTRNSDQPGIHDIRGKVSTYAFTIKNNSTWIVLSNLDFFATTVFISGDDKRSDVSNIRLESLHFSYPSYSKRMLGSLAIPNMTTIYYNGLLTKYAGNFSVFNCTWEYADGQTFRYRGADGWFENNLWHHNDFTCVGNGMLFHSEGVRDNFIRNTVHSNGPCEGFCPGEGTGEDRKLGLPIGATVQLNLFYDLKYLQNDGSHVQTGIYSQNGTILEYNWSYDTMKFGLRFDRIMEKNASWGYNGTVRYNVVWGTRGIMIKGDDHHVENNLSFDNGLPYDLGLLGYPGKGSTGENMHTVTSDNILQHGACPDYREENCTYTQLPGNFTNNVVGDVRRFLRDPENLDFRPMKNTEILAEGIGPYGKESVFPGFCGDDSSSSSVYWIPGRQQLLASMPIPPNGTTTAKCDADLMWLAGYGAQAHTVYFDANMTTVATADSTSPALICKLKTPANVVGLSKLLKSGTRYYWRVDSSKDAEVESKGHVWQFECKN